MPSIQHARRAVFLDKDGTLIENIAFNVDPARIRLLPGVRPALAQLHAAGYLLIVVSNQSGVAHGYFPESALDDVWCALRRLVAPVPLHAIYYCPHHPEGGVPGYNIACDCRKPYPGLLLHAAQANNIDLSASWLIGDILNDIEAGQRAGCHTLLLDQGNETEWRDGPYRTPHYIVNHWDQVAATILAASVSGAAVPQEALR
jgi:histidinol-phosphate phosphatase family protein